MGRSVDCRAMTAIPRRSLADQVAEGILALILDGPLAEGAPLPTTAELAARFDVSAVVVREAMAALAGRGIVARRQGREAVVARPGPEVLDSIFRVRARQDSTTLEEAVQVRAALELQSAALAAQRDGAAEPLLRARVEAMLGARSSAALAEHDRAFHAALAELAGNRVLHLLLASVASVVGETVDANVRRLVAEHGLAESRLRVARSHEPIVDAVVARDPAAATRAMADHFVYWLPPAALGCLVAFAPAAP